MTSKADMGVTDLVITAAAGRETNVGPQVNIIIESKVFCVKI